MKRTITIFALAAAMLMCGCSADTDSTEKSAGSATAESNVSIEVTAKQVLDFLDGKDYAAEMDAVCVYGELTFDDNCEKLFGVTADKLSDGGIRYVSSGSYADEVSIISSDGETDCEALLKERVEARAKVFEGYSPDELDKINSAEIFSCGGFWVMVISDDAVQIKQDILGFCEG